MKDADPLVSETLDGILTVCDSGASTFAASAESDFAKGTLVRTEGDTQRIQGIAGGLKMQGRGQCRFEVLDHHGHKQVITGEGILLEELHCRLIPPQKIMADDDEGYFRINGKGAQLVFANNNGKVQTPIDPKSGLPMLTMFHNIDDAAEKLEVAMHSCVAAENNQNLSPSQKEMLRWHFRLGHASMSAMHWLARRGLLGKLSERLLRVNETPLCAACQHGKQVRRPTGATLTTERSDKIGGIRDGKLEPGDEVAVDQCEV